MIITFNLPAKLLKPDDKGNYGLWFDNRLPVGKDPELWNVYNNIVTEYDPQTGRPVKFARDDPNLYPVFVPKQFIMGIATRTKK